MTIQNEIIAERIIEGARPALRDPHDLCQTARLETVWFLVTCCTIYIASTGTVPFVPIRRSGPRGKRLQDRVGFANFIEEIPVREEQT